MSDKHVRHTIGWWERVDLPEWEIHGLHAKVDTGARTSALHVEDLDESREGWVRFTVVLSLNDETKRVRVDAPVVKVAHVKSSTGTRTERHFVRAKIRIGPVVKTIDISLVARPEMTFRMLLGREALEQDFTVDASRANLMGK